MPIVYRHAFSLRYLHTIDMTRSIPKKYDTFGILIKISEERTWLNIYLGNMTSEMNNATDLLAARLQLPLSNLLQTRAARASPPSYSEMAWRMSASHHSYDND